MPTSLRSCLLVDDDKDDHYIFAEAIKELDDRIVINTAFNGVEGLAVLKSIVVPDCIFLDLNMPKMDGKEFLKRIKVMPALKDIPVFVLTTSSSPLDKRETISLGAMDCLTKPVFISLLVKALQNQVFPIFQTTRI